MFIIRTYAALSDVSAVLEGNEVHGLLEAHIERLAEYAAFDLPDLAMFAIVMPGDTLDSIEDDLGRSLIDSAGAFIEPPEIIQKHRGWFEAAIILSDDGFGLILFVPIDSATDARLTAAIEAAFAEATQAF
ncbi:hypothetical protein [Novosphingobium sp. Leaf2]|uniref:hypothetical protein n=1 Tax=Novosphingobium sp. Leaf2 TaxID=1735670 RepID=UPI0006FD3421|nr:hypothetical protein [Novosphingobium sp. Leaf2]KQM13889.1 hypothetical protein ASE49_12710 [Novosphingobium sp. Leaf2]